MVLAAITADRASAGSSSRINLTWRTLRVLAMSSMPRAAVGEFGSLRRKSSQRSETRSAASLPTPSDDISPSASRLLSDGTGALRTCATMGADHGCRAWPPFLPSIRRPVQSANLDLASFEANTRSKLRRPIVRGDRAKVDMLKVRRNPGQSAVVRRRASSSAFSASNTTIGARSSRNNASINSVPCSGSMAGSMSATALGARRSAGWSEPLSVARATIDAKSCISCHSDIGTRTLRVRTHPARGASKSCQVRATT